MGPLGVVDLEPGLGDLAHLLEGVEEIGVEDLFAEVATEPLDEGVLIRLPRLDIADRNALGCAPVDEGLRRELGPIVPAEWRSAAGGGSILGAGQAEPRRGP
jgi:hypothetical protein